MANATGTPQSALYAARGANSALPDGNMQRNRSAEQQHSSASGNPYNYNKRGNGMNYAQFLNGQDPALSRYTPSTLRSTDPTRGTDWNNNRGGYAYNLPTSFGGFGGFSQFSRQQQPPAQMDPDPREAQFRQQAAQAGMQRSNRQFSPGIDPSTIKQQNPTYDQLMRMIGVGGSIGGPQRYTV